MRVTFKSLPIVQAYSQDVGARSRLVTTTYDMADVRDHVLDAPWGKVAFRWQYQRNALLAWGLFAMASLHVAKYDPVGKPVIFFGGVLVSLIVTWWVAATFSREAALTEHAQKERELGPEAQLKVVEEKDWTSFKKRLI